MSQILKNVTIRRISLVKRGANNQKLQFCKSVDNETDIVCYECSMIRKDGEMSPEMAKEIDSIIASNDSASDALTCIAMRNVQLTPNEPVEPQFRQAVYEAMQQNPHLYEQHVRTVFRDELNKMGR